MARGRSVVAFPNKHCRKMQTRTSQIGPSGLPATALHSVAQGCGNQEAGTPRSPPSGTETKLPSGNHFSTRSNERLPCLSRAGEAASTATRNSTSHHALQPGTRLATWKRCGWRHPWLVGAWLAFPAPLPASRVHDGDDLPEPSTRSPTNLPLLI